MSRNPLSKVMGIAIAAALLLPVGGAEAQEVAVSDAPAASSAGEGAQGTSKDTSKDSNALLKEASIGRISSISGKGTRVPERHTVQSGDTLWDITETHHNNPYMWPAIWAYNPQITNPHWIFPGDTVYLRPADDGSQSAVDFLGRRSKPGNMMLLGVFYTERDLEKSGRILFSPEEKTLLTLEDEAYVSWKTQEERDAATPGQRFVILRKGDLVYDAESGDKPKSVEEEEKEAAEARGETPPEGEEEEDDDDEKESVYKLRVVGTLDIIYNNGKQLPAAKITNSYDGIKRGDLLLPIGSLIAPMVPKGNKSDVDGRIMDIFEGLTQVGDQQVVLLDRGVDDGVQVGNRFLVFERRDGLTALGPREKTDEEEEAEEKRREALTDEERRREDRADRTWEVSDHHSWPLGSPPEAPNDPFGLHDDEDEEFKTENMSIEDIPQRLIGEIIVVHSEGRYSTGVITQSVREINLNHQVRMIAGY